MLIGGLRKINGRKLKKQVLLGLLMMGQSLVFARPQTEVPKGCAGSTVDLLGPEAAKKARAFLDELKVAVKLDDKTKIASMVAYPLRLYVGDEARPIRNRAQFLAKYPEIFTQHVKQVVGDQSPRCLFGNWQGEMVGRGEVWFQLQADGAFKVITVQALDTFRELPKR